MLGHVKTDLEKKIVTGTLGRHRGHILYVLCCFIFMTLCLCLFAHYSSVDYRQFLNFGHLTESSGVHLVTKK